MLYLRLTVSLALLNVYSHVERLVASKCVDKHCKEEEERYLSFQLAVRERVF